MNAAQATDIDFKKFEWPTRGVTRAPYRLFTDPEIYQQEQQRIFRGRVWSFLGLEIVIRNPGDVKTTTVGETPVIVTRDQEGKIHECADGAVVCNRSHGPSVSRYIWPHDCPPAKNGRGDNSILYQEDGVRWPRVQTT